MTYLQIMAQSFHNPSLVRLLQNAVELHRLMEEDFSNSLKRIGSENMDFQFPHMELSFPDYFQKNFFSILFLSIFKQLNIPDERIRFYGIILHSIRGVVTASDNILDEEDKGAVRINIAMGNILPNIFLILLQQGVLIETLTKIVPDRTKREKAFGELMGALFDIASEESHEEGRVETVLSPENLLREIHRLRGGRLLELAFIVPEVTEENLAEDIQLARQSVHQIGLALQMMDDITDIYIDIKSRNHNFLRSWIIHKGPDGPMTDEQLLERSKEELAEPAKPFPKATCQVLELLVETAVKGFTGLEKIGYPINRHDALQLIGILFQIRGLSSMWALSQGER